MTGYLYSRPSFLKGMARVLDLARTLSVYNGSPTPEIADQRAMASDWATIGNDMRGAIQEFEKTHETKRKQKSRKTA